MFELAEKLSSDVERKGIACELLLADEDVQWFVVPLYAMGRQANNVTHEFADDHPALPLRQIDGLRHRLVHRYEPTNWRLISDVVLTEVPALRTTMYEVLGF